MIAVLALPASASASYLVPPENSAATQYTEAIPTAGGDREADGRQSHSHRSPSQVLGARNVHRLDDQGPEGRAAAEVATETASAAYVPSEGAATSAEGTAPSSPAGRRATGQRAKQEAPRNNLARPRAEPRSSAAQPGGSSGLAETLAHATGTSSSNGVGPLLPLAILATIAWSVAYVVRRHEKSST